MSSSQYWELTVGVPHDLSEGLTNLAWELGALGVVEEERPGHGAAAGCLEALEAVIDRDGPSRMLDVGTGSGILAIAAARLGVGAILAVDDDPDAVACAMANVARNHVSDRVRCALADATALRESRVPLLVANLLSAAHRRLAAQYLRSLTPGGTLLPGGILDGDEATGTVLGVDTNEHESPVRITLLQSVPKGDKMESIVRASTELGVVRVVPVLTARTIVALDAGRWRDRARRWQRVAKEAAKQCGRALVPPVDVPRPLGEALELGNDADLRLCLWEGARGAAAGQGEGEARLLGTTLAASLPLTLPGGSRIALLIGPAGGRASDA